MSTSTRALCISVLSWYHVCHALLTFEMVFCHEPGCWAVRPSKCWSLYWILWSKYVFPWAFPEMSILIAHDFWEGKSLCYALKHHLFCYGFGMAFGQKMFVNPWILYQSSCSCSPCANCLLLVCDHNSYFESSRAWCLSGGEYRSRLLSTCYDKIMKFLMFIKWIMYPICRIWAFQTVGTVDLVVYQVVWVLLFIISGGECIPSVVYERSNGFTVWTVGFGCLLSGLGLVMYQSGGECIASAVGHEHCNVGAVGLVVY